MFAAANWFFVVVLFGDIVYERGPMAESVCKHWKDEVSAQMLEAQQRNEVPKFLGKELTKVDVELRCEQR